jgi:hypothetical protein
VDRTDGAVAVTHPMSAAPIHIVVVKSKTHFKAAALKGRRRVMPRFPVVPEV